MGLHFFDQFINSVKPSISLGSISGTLCTSKFGTPDTPVQYIKHGFIQVRLCEMKGFFKDLRNLPWFSRLYRYHLVN